VAGPCPMGALRSRKTLTVDGVAGCLARVLFQYACTHLGGWCHHEGSVCDCDSLIEGCLLCR